MSTKATANIKEIIEEINKLRENPSEYAKKVEEYTHYFTDNVIKLPNLNIKIRTQEGVVPYTETIEYLKAKTKTNTLIPSKALCEIAKEIADNVIDSETGEIDEELHEKIIEKHGSFEGKFTRAMDFGGFTSEQVVINFLVCDGDPDRSQREPLLGDGLNKIGVAFGKHNIYSTICVLVTCTQFNNSIDPDDIMVFEDEQKEKERLEQERLEQERLEKERLEQEKLEQERLEKERLEKERREKDEQERLEKERLEKERLEKERLERERAEQEKLEREKLEKEEKDKKALEDEKEKEKERLRIEEEKRKEEERRKEEEKRKEEERRKAEEKRKEEEKRKAEEKKKEEEKKKKEITKKKYQTISKDNTIDRTNIFKLKKRIQSYETVPKDQLPEGVASMTKSDTIIMEGGKRYKKIIYNKVMLDGSKKTEEVKQCLD